MISNLNLKEHYLGGETNWQTIAFAVLATLLSLAYYNFGWGKIIGMARYTMWNDMYYALPPLLGTFDGIIELTGAVGLIWFRTRALAALCLLVPTIGAHAMHNTFDHMLAPHAILLTLLFLLTAWGARRPLVEYVSKGFISANDEQVVHGNSFKVAILGTNRRMITNSVGVLAVVIGLIMVRSGFLKIFGAGTEELITSYGLSAGHILLAGCFELIAGFALLWYRTRCVGALVLLAPIIGAFTIQLAYNQIGQVISAVILGLFCLTIGWLFRQPFVEFVTPSPTNMKSTTSGGHSIVKTGLSFVAVILYIGTAVLSATSVPPGKIELEQGYEAYINRDYQIAFEQIEPLAEQGDATARYFLGAMYEFGRGVEQDRIRARMWYSLTIDEDAEASRMGSLGERYRQFVSNKMGPLEIEESERMVQAWRETH